MEEYSDGLWYGEHDASDGTHYYSVRSILFNGETNYHEVKILVTEEWGKTLILDGEITSTEFDEAIFHEALVHPAMMAHGNPRSVLVIGGDDGAVLREVLAHASVEQVVMTGVDEELVDICAEHLPEWSKGSLEDPRVEFVFEDTSDYLKGTKTSFDVIIADLSDYAEANSPIDLQSEEFYRRLSSCLAPDGALVVHGVDFDTADCSDYLAYRRAIAQVFPLVKNYTALVPSFRGETMFMVASNTVDPSGLSRAEIEKRLKECGRDADLGSTLHYYDADAHFRMFSLPKNLKAPFRVYAHLDET
jgi:spermidine synthase